MRDLFTAWERGLALGAVDRGLILLELACPEMPPGQRMALPIGERDRRLLALRASLFGARLVGRVDCPRCGEPLELEASTDELTCAPIAFEPALALRGYALDLRLPNSDDLRVSVEVDDDPAVAGQALIRRCIVSARRGDLEIAAEDLPAAVLDDVAEHIAASDPQADVRLVLSCAACNERCHAPFDIVSFMWTELEAWVERSLREVHTLARAYGWTESEVFALGPLRRDAYLRMVLE